MHPSFGGAGIKPIHCLLVVGSKGVAIRRWSDGTLLTGRPFDGAGCKRATNSASDPSNSSGSVGKSRSFWPNASTAVKRAKGNGCPLHPAGGRTAEKRRASPPRTEVSNNTNGCSRLRPDGRTPTPRQKADRTIEKLNRKLGDLRGQMATLASSSEGLSNQHAETIRRLDEELRQQRQDRRSAESQFEVNREHGTKNVAVWKARSIPSGDNCRPSRSRGQVPRHGRPSPRPERPDVATAAPSVRKSDRQANGMETGDSRPGGSPRPGALSSIKSTNSSGKWCRRRNRTAGSKENAATFRDQNGDTARPGRSAPTRDDHADGIAPPSARESAVTLRDQTAALRGQIDHLSAIDRAETESHRRQQGESEATLRDQTSTLRDQIDQLQREMASQTESHRRQQGESTATLAQYAAELKELRAGGTSSQPRPPKPREPVGNQNAMGLAESPVRTVDQAQRSAETRHRQHASLPGVGQSARRGTNRTEMKPSSTSEGHPKDLDALTSRCSKPNRPGRCKPGTRNC